jgi:two-component system, OmpR family, alkaline phosphatase synthesis response regulator PhoP
MAMGGTRILVADDEEHIRHLLRMYLSREGYRVDTAEGGQEALDKVHRLHPDLVLLDVMMPELDGWEVCRRVRRESNVPVIMLTARGDAFDKVVGLELGADDYVTKPFHPRELVARVRAVLRRAQAAPEPDGSIDVADVHVDPARREVHVEGTEVPLRAKEFDVLLVLAQEQGRVVTREALLRRAWGYDYLGESRTVDVHVSGLRDRLAGAGAGVQIQSVRGLGYKLVALQTAQPEAPAPVAAAAGAAVSGEPPARPAGQDDGHAALDRGAGCHHRQVGLAAHVRVRGDGANRRVAPG